jgi:hypothetical protein
MKRTFVAMLLLLWNVNAFADSQAVQKFNAIINYSAWDTFESSVRTNNSYAFNGAITFPLAPYLGASLSGAFGSSALRTNYDANGKPSTTTTSCSIGDDNLGATLFVRDPTLGRLGVSYGAGRQKSRCSGTFLTTSSDSQDTSGYGVSAEYYFSKITIGAAMTKTNLGSSSELKSSALSVGWYPLSDLRFEMSAAGGDLQNSYHVGLEYRPAFLDESISLLLGYTYQNLLVETHTIMVGISYFFEKHVPLITRDRYYQ